MRASSSPMFKPGTNELRMSSTETPVTQQSKLNQSQNAVLITESKKNHSRSCPFLNFSPRKKTKGTRHGKLRSQNLTLEVDNGGNLHGHGPGEMVDVEVQVRELGQLPNLPRYGPLDTVVVEVQPLEPPQPGHRRRQGSREPAALQRDRGDAAVAAAGHADEGAGAWVAGGVPGAEDPAGRVQRLLERRQRAGVLLVARGGADDGEEQEHEGERKRQVGEEAEARGRHGSRGLGAAERGVGRKDRRRPERVMCRVSGL